MTSQHTPGPWVAAKAPDGYAYISGGNWINFARVVTVMLDEQDERPEGAANARLIAEAPSTLAALEHLLDAMEPPRSRKASEAWDAAQAAVRRARTATD
jgi:hypothetical protein